MGENKMDKLEIEKLKSTLNLIRNSLEEEKNGQGKIRNMYKNDPINMDRALRESAKRIRKLAQSI